MQSTTRTSSKNRSSEKPPTSWRSPNIPTTFQDFQHRRSNSTGYYDTPRGFIRSPPRSSSLVRHPLTQRAHNELSIRRHITRDSMLDNILLSFNQMPDGQGPLPKQPPLYSSFQDGEFKLDTPCFVYDAVSNLSSKSRSSSFSSAHDLHSQTSFNPYQIRITPVRQSSLPKPRSAATLRPHSKRSPSRKVSPTPRARLRHEASTMSVPIPTRRDGHGRSRGPSASVDLGPSSVDQTKWSKRRSRSINVEDTPIRRPRPTPSRGESAVTTQDFTNTTTATVTTGNRTTTTTTSTIQTTPSSLGRRSRPSSIQVQHSSVDPPQINADFIAPVNNWTNIATTTPSEPVQMNNDRPSVSDVKYRPQILIDALRSEAPQLDASPAKKSKIQSDTNRERPGFLRRVFGSSRTTPTASADKVPQLAPSVSIEKNDSRFPQTDRTQSAIRGQAESMHEPLEEVSSTPAESLKEDQPLSDASNILLQKKTSFFRRLRKASTTDQNGEVDPMVAALGLGLPTLSTVEASSERNNERGKSRDITQNGRIAPVPHANDSPMAFIPGLAIAGEPMDTDEQRPRTPMSLRYEQGIGTSSIRRKRPDTSGSQKSRHTPESQWQLSPLSTDGPAIGDSSPLSMLSAQFAAANLNDVESSPSTPSLPPITRAEYPASLQALRTGLAISTDEPMPVFPQYDNNYTYSVPAPPMADSPSRPSRRIWIQPNDSDEEMNAPIRTSMAPSPVIHQDQSEAPTPVSSIAISIPSSFNSTSTFAPSSAPASTFAARNETAPSLPSNPLVPTQADVEIATKLFFGDETQVERVGEVLGQPGAAGERLRHAYMELLDLEGFDVLPALRQLCERLRLRGESQQIGRILTSFSQRWCECNQGHALKSEGIVNSITYALLLLNTDLHIADVEEKMSRQQFVRNTMTAIRPIAEEIVLAEAASIGAGRRPSGPISSTPTQRTTTFHKPQSRPSLDTRSSDGRSSKRPSVRPASGVSSFRGLDSRNSDTPTGPSSTLLDVSNKLWEAQIEAKLKDFYNSIRQHSLPLSSINDLQLYEKSSNASLSVHSGTVKRTGSIMSKVPPETVRGRVPDYRTANRWNPRNRSRGKLSTASITSGRTSVEDIFSPSASSTWSNAMSRTQTSISSDSFGDMRAPDSHSVGFVNALNQAMGRAKDERPVTADETKSTKSTRSTTEGVPLDMEVLMLAGAPWAKEGMVQHKHHLEATDKKAKERNWAQCFAVVEKGNMRLFSFTSKASVRSQRNKSVKGGVVGGGNWTQSAESLNAFPLRQTLASILPPPGFKGRPYVFSLRLSNGALHLFEVGTPEIAEEFVSTANYWSARLSKEPLVGGVSSVEYGWSNAALANSSNDIGGPSSARAATGAASQSFDVPGRSSFQGSVRSSFEMQRNAPRARLPGDRMNLADWTPPAQNLKASTLGEAAQLSALMNYVKSIEEELATHNELRQRITSAYSLRHPNYTKAMANWEKKSVYLLTESTKFSTYVDSLSVAQIKHDQLRRERDREATMRG